MATVTVPGSGSDTHTGIFVNQDGQGVELTPQQLVNDYGVNGWSVPVYRSAADATNKVNPIPAGSSILTQALSQAKAGATAVGNVLGGWTVSLGGDLRQLAMRSAEVIIGAILVIMAINHLAGNPAGKAAKVVPV